MKWQTYPQSTKGSGGYPSSGGGISDGGRLPHDTPILSCTTTPVDHNRGKVSIMSKSSHKHKYKATKTNN